VDTTKGDKPFLLVMHKSDGMLMQNCDFSGDMILQPIGGESSQWKSVKAKLIMHIFS